MVWQQSQTWYRLVSNRLLAEAFFTRKPIFGNLFSRAAGLPAPPKNNKQAPEREIPVISACFLGKLRRFHAVIFIEAVFVEAIFMEAAIETSIFTYSLAPRNK